MNKILNLFGPTEGPRAEFIRDIGRRYMQNLNCNASVQSICDKELDLLVKVNMVVKLNTFEDEKGCYLFDEMSRFSHSCTANCAYRVKDHAIRCMAVKHIQEGEELTISYNLQRDSQPTHERRYSYHFLHGFTCHCPRCDAIGDDTRQFDCFDPACKGVMMVHQPLNTWALPFPNCTYTGVDYVKPHLLPCSVCHRPAPADYQAEMFELENMIPDFAAHLNEKLFFCNSARLPVQNWEFVLDEIDNFKLPRRHMMTKMILSMTLFLLDHLHHHQGDVVAERKRRAAQELIELVINVFPQPHDEVEEKMKFVWRLCGSQSFRPVLSLEEEKELLQKILRMHLILHGRDKRLVKEEKVLSDVLARLPQAQEKHNTEMCAFCGECSQHAAISLKQCPKCNKVAYCSEVCRQSHAKVHAMVCCQVFY